MIYVLANMTSIKLCTDVIRIQQTSNRWNKLSIDDHKQLPERFCRCQISHNMLKEAATDGFPVNFAKH